MALYDNYYALKVQPRQGIPYDNHAFYDTCIRFITAPRTVQQIEQLEKDSTGPCTCDLTNPELRVCHAVAEEATADHDNNDMWLAEFSNELCNQLLGALRHARDEGNTHKVSRNARKAAKAGRIVNWPTKPQDVIPYGPDISLRSLSVWTTYAHVPKWFDIVACILGICKTQVIGPLISSGLPDSLITTTVAPWIDLEQKPESTPLLALELLVLLAPIYSSLSELCQDEDIVQLVSRMDEQAECGNRVRAVDAIGLVLSFTQNASRLLLPRSVEVDRDLNTLRVAFETFGARLHSALKLPRSDIFHPLVVERSALHESGKDNPWVMAYETYHTLSTHHRCFAPGCRRTFAGEERSFDRCSGCGRVPYCSRECQIMAWKYKQAPHKKVCEPLRKLAETVGLPKKVDGGEEERNEFIRLCADTTPPVDMGLVMPVALYLRRMKGEDTKSLEQYPDRMAQFEAYIKAHPIMEKD